LSAGRRKPTRVFPPYPSPHPLQFRPVSKSYVVTHSVNTSIHLNFEAKQTPRGQLENDQMGLDSAYPDAHCSACFPGFHLNPTSSPRTCLSKLLLCDNRPTETRSRSRQVSKVPASGRRRISEWLGGVGRESLRADRKFQRT